MKNYNDYLSRTIDNLKEQFGVEELAKKLETSKMYIQDNRLEKSVLGVILSYPKAVWNVNHILRPDIFSDNKHQRIFKACQSIIAERREIDMLSVRTWLKQNDRDFGTEDFNSHYISTLTNEVVSPANLKFHVECLRQLYIVRKVFDVIEATKQRLLEGDYSAIGRLSESLYELENEYQTGNNQTKTLGEAGKEIVDEYYEKYEKMKQGIITGIPTGFLRIDENFSFMEPGEMIVIGARPSMGKTALALSIINNIAKDKKSVAFFSLEMTYNAIAKRIASSELKITFQAINNPPLDENTLEDFNNLEWADKPVYIDDTPAITPHYLRTKVRQLKQTKGIHIVVIDYLQLMKMDKAMSNSFEEVTRLSGEVKNIAKEFDIPVILLSQLSRKNEDTGRKPIMSDLRQSGAVEQDADKIFLIHRDAYYFDNNQETERNQETEIICVKNRNGAVGSVNLMFDTHTTTFYEPEAIDDFSNEIEETEAPY